MGSVPQAPNHDFALGSGGNLLLRAIRSRMRIGILEPIGIIMPSNE
jgi:hypothetical protein